MRHVHILKKLENNHFIFKTVFVHVPQARVLKNQINIQCKGAQNVIQDLHFSSEICVVQKIPLDHLVSPKFPNETNIQNL